THRKELGILKALGYTNFYISKHFAVFGLSVFTGCAVGFGGAWLLLPTFYDLQNKDSFLPTLPLRFHPSIAIGFVLLPTILFALLSVLYAFWKLRAPVLSLLQNAATTYGLTQRGKAPRVKKVLTNHSQTEKLHNEKPFLSDLRSSTLRQKKSLSFFMLFSAFCFSALTQMAFRMQELASLMMGTMMLIIGLVLSFTTLYLAITTVIGGNRQTLSIMRAFGYSDKDCRRAILDCYRPLSYIGFAVGTLYQHLLLLLMIRVVYANVDSIPTYEFDFGLMMISLVVFFFVYEIVMACYTRTLRRISLKEIMLS
ncbi:MAG: ABC transporter permease, partial [Lachnospiraceae bacterium]|nr:ABC transporter permease [Lachnospiraceae bacterium]